MDENTKSAWIDYDLFCRLSRRYRFYYVDQVLAHYRLHPDSKTSRSTETERLEEAICLSRRHWGSPLRPGYWALASSLALHRLNRTGRARRFLNRARDRWLQHHRLEALVNGVGGIALAPEITFDVITYFLRLPRVCGASVPPQSAVYFDHTEPWPDGWVGPRLIASVRADDEAKAVEIRGWRKLSFRRQPLMLTVSVNGSKVGQHTVDRSGDFVARIALPRTVPAGILAVEVKASSWFVRHCFAKNWDFRPLSWRLGSVRAVR
jgi:hypothetical protein